MLSCFGANKGERCIVATSRIHEGNAATGHHQSNQPQATGLSNQATSMLAPPSSPASFSHSPAPSTMQSPNSQLSLSANSPGGPSSAMFKTGPYAHETQLVSPPVFSTYTTEPSTAPLTPPLELAHLITPSSLDVPYARFLTSADDLKKTEKGDYISANDLHATYTLYLGNPASSLRSPITRISGGGRCSSFPERDCVSSHCNGILWLRQEQANVRGVTLVMHRRLRQTVLQRHIKVQISSALTHLLDTILTMMLLFLKLVED